MKRVLIAILAGVLLTVFFFVLSVLFGGACHCVTPTTIFFPYAAIVLGGFSWESMSPILIAVQFPLYSIIVAEAKGNGRKTLVSLVLLVFHAVATMVGLKVYHH
jgi:hypothetical protein